MLFREKKQSKMRDIGKHLWVKAVVMALSMTITELVMQNWQSLEDR
jgi:hypothetical protein